MGGTVNTTYGVQNFGFSTTNATGPGNIYAALQGMLPYAVPYDSTGKRILLPGGDINISNPVDENDYNINLRKTLRVLGSIYAEVKIVNGLRYRVNFGPDFQNYYNGRWMDANSINRGGGNPGSTNYAQLNQTSNLSWTLDNLLYYDKSIKGTHNHDFGVTLLQSSLYRRSETSSMTATKLPLPNQKWYALNAVSALDGFSSGLTENSITSYMARVNYAFDQKYLITAFVRWDGASVLAAGNKWDVFPSVSIGWRLDNEPFMKDATWITSLKLRAGIATVGNAAVGPYTTLGGLQG
ncbi:MAG: TonB-dependent receptor, partial [Sphingobacteriales bacterium]